MFRYYVLAFLSVILYLHGFFPIPPVIQKEATKSFEEEYKPFSNFKKVVFIVIDALRYDFVTTQLVPQAYRLSEENGCLIRLKAETPTVTLPRIKALTTGNVAQFIDIVINLANPQILHDSFVHRAVANNKKLVFYGDETWLKLFPNLFARSEGTTSFFVNDFYEVDNNVTRNVHKELEKTDWDLMILHYLGLDHIGHVFGPKSNLIPQKLKEMDSIIAAIKNKLNDSLIIVTSDHGMRDSGGHGGTTSPEVNIPFLIIGMPCFNDYFAQTDVAANLAILSGFHIPSTSIGRLQPSLMNHLPLNQYLKSLKYNTKLLKNKLDACGDDVEAADYYSEIYFKGANEKYGNLSVELYQKCLMGISQKLQIFSIKQNFTSLVISIVIGLIVILQIYHEIFQKKREFELLEYSILIFILVLQFLEIVFYINIATVFISVFILIKNAFRLKYKRPQSFLLLVITIFQPVSFASSSYLEEEHQFWYFCFNSFLIYKLFSEENKLYPILLMIGFRFLRTLNQVGDKFASSPDISDWLLKQENYLCLQFLFLIGLFLSGVCANLFTKANKKFNAIIDGIILCLIYSFRSVLNENIVLGKFLWVLIFLKLITCFYSRNSFLTVWILVISLLLKPYNVILIPFCVFVSFYLNKIQSNYENLIIGHWCLGNVLFFAHGHDNSLASVDISSGYIGLESYQPIFVIIQVLCHTFALPVLSHILVVNSNQNVDKTNCFLIFLLLRINVIIVVFIVTFIQRHHLFIWSVFAPKIFVEASHFGVLFIEIICYYIYMLSNKLFCN